MDFILPVLGWEWEAFASTLLHILQTLGLPGEDRFLQACTGGRPNHLLLAADFERVCFAGVIKTGTGHSSH